MKVINEQVFGVPNTSFGVSGSVSGFTLNYSVDGEKWAQWSEATKADEPIFVVNVPKFMKYKLVGNTDTVEVRW